MIVIGAALVQRFEWIMYIFGVFLLWSAYKMWKSGEESVDLEDNSTIKLVKKIMPVTTQFDKDKFFIKRMNVMAATPLFVALMAVETTDVMFAFDSVPAIFAITSDPFLGT